MQASGWSNYNGLIVNYQRLFHHGVAYQISHVFDKSLQAVGTKYYNKDEVLVTLLNGKQVPLAYDAGPEGAGLEAHTELWGPINWQSDASLFKVFPITERVHLRFNMDAFNVFNVQGDQNPNGETGIEKVQAGVGQVGSYWAPRQIQFTLRLTF